jgi:hypothetical protein
MSGESDLEQFRSEVEASLATILGESGAKAILFYLGEPDPETFEKKLNSILGNGASVIVQELKRQQGGKVAPRKHHWFSRARAFEPHWSAGMGWLVLPSLR